MMSSDREFMMLTDDMMNDAYHAYKYIVTDHLTL